MNNSTFSVDRAKTDRRGIPGLTHRLVLGLALALATPAFAAGADTARTFATPDEAATSLGAAAKASDREALRSLFGPAVADVQNPDQVQAENELGAFATAFNEGHRLVPDGEGKQFLEVGSNHWPFPIPIVRRDGRWFFDTVAGKEELLNRRIGRNELEVLEVVRAYVDAQREYASRDRDGDEVLEFAQRLMSHAGTRDGLYWPLELDGETSPLGPLVADAQGEGYSLHTRNGDAGPRPFHGYYFKILTRQGKSAPGGDHDYIINGNMIAGFALVAWPVEYRESGVMTFIVNQQGRVYQRDLGRNTSRIAGRMKAYNPDSGWSISPD
jgi:hypothetical protein